MKKIDQFINQYQMQKTLRFSLIPQGKTEENFISNSLLEQDVKRYESYKKAKRLIDEYHKAFIEKSLTDFSLDNLIDYSTLYYTSNKTEGEKQSLENIAIALRKEILDRFKSQEGFSKLFKEDMIKKILPQNLTNKEDIELMSEFSRFSTYFTGFHENRKNLYSSDAKATAISYRIINENLPKFLDNSKSFVKIIKHLPKRDLEILNTDFKEIFNTSVEDCFSIHYFNFTMSQSGIEKYNQIIGGYSNSDGSKVKGLNEYINLFNQQNKEIKLPKLKPLFKQILSDKSTISFIPESFKTDNETLKSIYDFYNLVDLETKISVKNVIENLVKLVEEVQHHNINNIYIKNGPAVSELSNSVFGFWGHIQNSLNLEYYENKRIDTNNITEEQEEKCREYFKKIKSFSILQLQKTGGKVCDDGDKNGDIVEYYKNKAEELSTLIRTNYDILCSILECYPQEKKLCKDIDAIKTIKEFLDSVKDFQLLLKPLLVNKDESDKDEVFYGEFEPLYYQLDNISKLYDKIRNYLTQKPYSKDKFKINFDCSSFLNGWAQDYSKNSAHIVEKNDLYYLAIVDKKLSAEDISLIEDSENKNANIIVYDFQKPDLKNVPRLFIRSKGDNFAPAVKEYGLPIDSILEIYDSRKFKTEHKQINEEEFKESLVKMIDYFKIGFSEHKPYKHFNFNWKQSEKYKNINEFYKDTIESCYALYKKEIDFDNLMNLVDKGKIYLFQIYNKDFSPHSKGTPNMHTLYFKALFDEENLKNIVYKLNGQAEVFYRLPSLDLGETTVHKSNQPINNKNELNPKKQSTFEYDIIKDRRFTKPQFSLHFPISLNFKAVGNKSLNEIVRKVIKKADDCYVIGIDRGERHLLYVSVINSNGEIVEQFSLNEIVNQYNNLEHRTDYHKLLETKEQERKQARQNWGTIENIKELKDGYISQVVHKICELVEKYDAIIAMEDLNSGFKNSRIKVEKQVYQKFEKMLIDKLNYYVDKKKNKTQCGGLLNAYQLTNKFESFKEMKLQNGFIFYIPAWLTSKIDPSTGFVDLLKPKYTSVQAAKEFIQKLDGIKYNQSENYFEFDIDYNNFPRSDSDYKKKWTICTYGERIKTFRNPEKNSEWDNKTIILTDEFVSLFQKYNIDYRIDNLKEIILSQTEKEFFKSFIYYLSLTLQMRNSITNSTVDYLISPVKNNEGCFYNSQNKIANQPLDADANGAYHIALKALWAVNKIKNTTDEDLSKVNLSISNKEWLEFVQKVKN